MKKSSFKKSLVYLLVFLLIFITSNFSLTGIVSAADEFDTMREKYVETLTGGTIDLTDPNVQAKVNAITNTAQNRWNSMVKKPTTHLWSDLSSTTDPGHITTAYERLYSMALAYRTTGSSLNGNAALLNDLKTGLDWMHANRYNSSNPKYGAGYHWGLGAPRPLVEITALLYSQLSSTQRTNYMNAVQAKVGNVGSVLNSSGCNRAWLIRIVAIRSIIQKSTSGVINARDGLSALFDYIVAPDADPNFNEYDDGFYPDGSFIQHWSVPYNAGYGAELLQSVAAIAYTLHGTSYAVNDPDITNMYQWIYDAYEPILYKGAGMDMFSGRYISRWQNQDHFNGHRILEGIVLLSQFAPSPHAEAFKSIVKYMVNKDSYRSFLVNAPLYSSKLAKAIVEDGSIEERAELYINKQYPSAARAVHRSQSNSYPYSFGVAMFNHRIQRYEILGVNKENKKGWYTGYGMTYIYNNHLEHYSNHFWPTVNPYRLPGTTVDTITRVDSSIPAVESFAIAGGASIGLHGVTGMFLVDSGTNLRANKSWFMFDDEVVALGSNIRNSGQSGNGWDNKARKVETIVENRVLNSSGNNTLQVNANGTTTTKSSSLDWSETMEGVNWAHLTGNVTGSNIGYYFPGGTTVKALRESRSGTYTAINSSYPQGDKRTNRFLTLWLDHGTNPTAASYSYVLLPNKTSEQVHNYAGNPNITILENSSSVHAVKENTLNTVGAFFWTDAVKWVQVAETNFFSSNKKAAIMTKETANDIEVAVSDPTQKNTGTIFVEINKRATQTISADSGITVTQLSPTIKFTVNVNNSQGKAFKAKFSLVSTPTPTPTPTTVVEFESLLASATVVSGSSTPYLNVNDSGASGGVAGKLIANAKGNYVSYPVNVPATGKYSIKVRIKTGPNRGTFQLSINGTNQGSPQNNYSTKSSYAEIDLGTANLTAGTNTFKYTITGWQTGTYCTLLLDYIKLD